MAGLEEKPRAGRPRTYSEIERGRIISLVLTNPKDLGLDFCHWTLDRIVEQVKAMGIEMKRTQIYTVLREEGIRWRKSRTWLKSTDPEFAEKRAEIIDLYHRRFL